MKLPSGASIPKVTREEADRRCYLTRELLNLMHLSPVGDPVAYDQTEGEEVVYFYDPARVSETPPELWYRDPSAPAEERETMTLESGTEIERIPTKRAIALGSKRIAAEFGLGIGISSGANFLASVLMDSDELNIATVFPDDNKKYITTRLSEKIDENPELISNRIKLIGFEVI